MRTSLAIYFRQRKHDAAKREAYKSRPGYVESFEHQRWSPDCAGTRSEESESKG